jgi:hypothetical protein
MNSKKIINIVFVLSLILISGFAVTPASANAPSHIEYPFTSSYQVENPCGFVITSHDSGFGYATMWYDENGIPDRIHQRWVGTEIWDAGGKTLEFTYNYPDRAWIEPAYPDGYIIYLGAYMVTLPHEGVVYSATGLQAYTFTLDEDGNLVLLDQLKQVGNYQADWDFLCEYLAP